MIKSQNIFVYLLKMKTEKKTNKNVRILKRWFQMKDDFEITQWEMFFSLQKEINSTISKSQ